MSEEQKPNFYDLYKTVYRMEGKLDTALKTIENHEKRINDVEKITDRTVGKLGVIGAIFGIIGTAITLIIRGKFFN